MTILCYHPQSVSYCFGPYHPLRPERFSLAVDLMRDWGLLDEATGLQTAPSIAVVSASGPCTSEDLLLVHSAAYVANVQAGSAYPEGESAYPGVFTGMGIGPGDTPPFEGMHEASALVCGATIDAVEQVVSGAHSRSFSPSGGLHHAHRDHASGFCIYNDVAVAIARATARHPGLRVAYVDIDAHHGDGVEAAFLERPDVLTLSVHESGRYLFPGTGRATDIGEGSGRGFSMNLPLPPYADPTCYEQAAEHVIEPALRTFKPELVVLQAGADTHREDSLTHLYQSVGGYAALFARMIRLADEVAEGRLVVTGGGGYQPFSEVPRMWASAMALLLDRSIPPSLPASWLERARDKATQVGDEGPASSETFAERLPELEGEQLATAQKATAFAIEQVRDASPLLGGGS